MNKHNFPVIRWTHRDAIDSSIREGQGVVRVTHRRTGYYAESVVADHESLMQAQSSAKMRLEKFLEEYHAIRKEAGRDG